MLPARVTRLDRWDQKATITERNEVTTEGRHGPLLLLLFIAGQVHAQRIFECVYGRICRNRAYYERFVCCWNRKRIWNGISVSASCLIHQNRSNLVVVVVVVIHGLSVRSFRIRACLKLLEKRRECGKKFNLSNREKFLTKGISFSNRTMSEEERRGKSKKFPTLNIGYRTGIKILPKITNGTEHWTL